MQEISYTIPLSDMSLVLSMWKNHVRLSEGKSALSLPAQLKSIHRHTSYEIFFLPQTTMTLHTLDGTERFSDAIVIIPPALSHYVSFDESPRGYYMYFSLESPTEKNGLAKKLTSMLERSVTTLPLTPDERFYIDHIEEALRDDYSFETAPSLFTLLFSELFSRLTSPEAKASDTRTKFNSYVNTIDLYIALHYADGTIRLSDLARELYLCEKQVSRILHRAYGCSLSELVNRNRLSAAQMLLRYTDLEIGEIATQVGYDHENYFFTVFRDAHGITPRQYREQFSGESHTSVLN